MHSELIVERLKKVPGSLTVLAARVFGVEGPNDSYRGVMFLVERHGRFDGFSVTKSVAGPERVNGNDLAQVRSALDSARQWYQSDWIEIIR